ncbi:hypothetical protein SEVIR_9G373850v4 [Setaria viridis]
MAATCSSGPSRRSKRCAKGLNSGVTTHFCQDKSRSSSANDIVKRVVGTLPVLVDHSIVESFVQGGRSTATSPGFRHGETTREGPRCGKEEERRLA